MKVQEIKKHIDNGHHVTINNGAYKLIKDNLNQYLIICLSNAVLETKLLLTCL